MDNPSWRLVAMLAPLVIAQSCVPLQGSKQCPAFQNASVSLDSDLIGFFPFLSFVSSVETFDQQLAQYVNFTYVQSKYRNTFACNNVNLTDTSAYYARYTTSVLCNSIIQNSINPCGLSGRATAPLCANSCAQYTITEDNIIANKKLCGTPGKNFTDELRADFIKCSLPDSSLTGSCITGEQNEPYNCGFAENLDGLCRYCSASSPNATDPCCYKSNATVVCEGVVLPSLEVFSTIISTTATTAAAMTRTTMTSGATSASSNSTTLPGGTIAGIVIGSIVATLFLAALTYFVCIIRRRRQKKYPSQANSGFSVIFDLWLMKKMKKKKTTQKARIPALQPTRSVDREPGIAVREESGVAVREEPGVAIDEKDGVGIFLH